MTSVKCIISYNGGVQDGIARINDDGNDGKCEIELTTFKEEIQYCGYRYFG